MTQRECTEVFTEILTAGSYLADDRELVSRVKGYLGHVEDMPDDERVLLLGALERRMSSND